MRKFKLLPVRHKGSKLTQVRDPPLHGAFLWEQTFGSTNSEPVIPWKRDLGATAGVLTHYVPTAPFCQGTGSAGCPWDQPGRAAAAGEGVRGVQGMQLLSGAQQRQQRQPWHGQ